MTNKTKVCRDCKKRKDISEYSVSNNRRGTTTYRPECKKCAAKNWREKHQYASTREIDRRIKKGKIDIKIKALKVLVDEISKEYKNMQRDLEKIKGGQ